MGLKIGPITPQRKVKLPGAGKVSVRIGQLFTAYQEAYEKEHGQPVSPDVLLEALLGHCFDTDKAFQAYLKKNPLNGSAIGVRRARRGPPGRAGTDVPEEQ